jgi:2,4-didehydro-3-deoxy-L-rhamnonate hydrolase
LVWHALAAFNAGGRSIPALVVNDAIYRLDDLLRAVPSAALQQLVSDGVANCFNHWREISAELARLAEQASDLGPGLDTNTADLARPYQPSRIFAAASNFIEHANEMGTVLAAKADSAPYVFIKAASSVIGPHQAIVLPPTSTQVDWEVELAAVIGIGGRHIAPERALEHVAAYTILNDISARDLTRRTDFPFKFDWFRGKSFDTFGPFGPWLVPASLIGDPQSLQMQLDVNGDTRQRDSTASMIFTVAEQISYLSQILTLEPGDVIATGTPAGVGKGHGDYLKDGDVVIATVERIGSLVNTVVSTDRAVTDGHGHVPNRGAASYEEAR